MLFALAHILGAAVALFCFSALLLFIATWEEERIKRRFLQEVAMKLGVSVEALNDDAMSDRIIKVAAERSSNELLKNRLSDLCGVVRAAWGWLSLLLQLGVLCWAVWATVSESPSEAPFAWLAVAIAVFFWVVGVAFSFLCYVLTGRYPGEARQTRKAVAQILK